MIRKGETMDSFSMSMSLGINGDSRSSTGVDSEDFVGDGDDSEEDQRLMEELLYCQVYFETGSAEIGGEKEECSLGVNASKTSVPSEVEENMANKEQEELKREVNEDHIGENFLKSSKKFKKKKKISASDESKTASITEVMEVGTSYKNSRNEEILLSDSAPIEIEDSSVAMMINSDTEIVLDSDSEECKADSESNSEAKTPKGRKKNSAKSSGKKSKEVIHVSDTSSDSSLFLDISSEDDIDIHTDKNDFTDSQDDDGYLQKILDSLPDCKWKINYADRFGSAEKSRYYNSAGKVRCNNCNNRGHFSVACPEPKKKAACILCGNRGHMAHHCSQLLCYRCNTPGHVARKCERKKIWHEDSCHRCGMHGHFKSECPDIWRQYHLTTAGNEIVKGPKMETHRKFCYNCAASGHFGHECRKRRLDIYLHATLPFVAKYDVKRVKKHHMKDQQDDYRSTSDVELQSKKSQLNYIESQNSGLTKRLVPLITNRNKTKKDLRHDLSRQSKSSYGQYDKTAPLNCDNSAYHSDSYIEQLESVSPEGDNPFRQNFFLSKRERNQINTVQKLKSNNLTNFAEKIKARILARKSNIKLKSPNEPKKKKKKNVFELDYLSLPKCISNSETDSLRRPSKLCSRKDRFLDNIIDDGSYSPACHSSLKRSYVDDFPRSNERALISDRVESLENLRNRNGFSNSEFHFGGLHSRTEDFDSPKDFRSNGNPFIAQSFDWKCTSTPLSKSNEPRREWSRKLSASELELLSDEEMQREYYGKKQMKNAKRKNRRKRKRALLAEDKASMSAKSKTRRIRKRPEDRKVIETEKGFLMTVTF